MSTITLEEAQVQLPELVDNLAAGEEVIIARAGNPWGGCFHPSCPKGPPEHRPRQGETYSLHRR